MKVLMVAHYCDYDTNPNNRFLKIAKMLADCGEKVDIITSSFNHTFKRQKGYLDCGLSIESVYEKGYEKNIGLKRIISHYFFSKKLKKRLHFIEKPDVIYCAIPSITCAETVISYAQKNNIKYILDVEDLWPEAFQMVLDNYFVEKTVYSVIRRRTNKIYRNADFVITVSDTYSERVRQIRRDGVSTVYLGINYENYFEKNILDIRQEKKENDAVTFVYIGTLGASYDVQTMILAFEMFFEKYKQSRLIIMGDGPLENKFKDIAKNSIARDNIEFLGRKPYNEMIDILIRSDIAINPIVKGSAGSVINKVCDYAAAGLPVINSQDNKEYRTMIESFQSGINVKCEDAKDMFRAMVLLQVDLDKRKKMSVNSYKMGVELFNRSTTYKEIINIIKGEKK